MKVDKTKASLGVFSLAMLITVAIDSVRNLPATALFGTSLIFFFVFACLVFLIPTALVSAELTSLWSKEGGIYFWVRQAFGEKIAFIAIWLQWINTMVWYPTILSFIAGTATFLFDPKLAENKIYLISIILFVFWFLTLLNLKGLKTSARFASFCAVFGMIIPMSTIIILAVIWLLTGKPIQLHITSENIIPKFGHTESWISLTAIMTSFLGLELATVHIRNIKNARKKFPKALFWSVIIIGSTMIFGSLSIAIVLPAKDINLVEGVMQVFYAFFETYHIGWVLPLTAISLLMGSLGSMVNWIISPAKGLMQAAEQGYLPSFFKKENKHQVPQHILITQAVLVSLICLSFLLMPSVNGSYWLLTDLSTQLYMLMYVLMFIAAIVIHYKFSASKKNNLVIPGGRAGYWIACGLGFLGCLNTIVVGFFPPSGIDVGGAAHYERLFVSGMIFLLLPILIFYGYKRYGRLSISRRSANK